MRSSFENLASATPARWSPDLRIKMVGGWLVATRTLFHLTESSTHGEEVVVNVALRGDIDVFHHPPLLAPYLSCGLALVVIFGTHPRSAGGDERHRMLDRWLVIQASVLP